MKNLETTILLIEDDHITLQLHKKLLSPYGRVFCAKTFQEALDLIKTKKFDLGFFDLNLDQELEGLELLKHGANANIYPIVVSGESNGKVLESAFTNGAKDYLLKPFTSQKLNQVIARFFNNKRHIEFEDVINGSFITKSKKQIQELYKIKNLAISDKPIFINGETGTGKRVVSHLIKKICGSISFIEVNCSQYTDNLLASELFGHKQGAFTGAVSDRKGILEEADGGIIFLDEIHALSPSAQKLLLKAIEEKEFYPVGANKPVRSNFRVITATCENIHKMIDDGLFREDLFARISTFQINLLPLRERKEDIILLLEHFISKHLVQMLITEDAKKILKAYSWPRNTREIQDIVENWIIDGVRLITPECIPSHIKSIQKDSDQIDFDLFLDLVEEHGLSNTLAYLKKEITLGLKKRHKTLKNVADVMAVSYPSLSAFLKQNSSRQLLPKGQFS